MKNLLRNFWLTLTRFKTASILNILGLTVALTVFMIIMTQTYWELTYNKNIKQHERIYRLTLNSDEVFSKIFLNRPLGEAIGTSSPDIETYTAFEPWTGEEKLEIKTLDNQGNIKEGKAPCLLVSSSITELLSLECLSGDFKRFKEPKTIIIAQSVANILFPDGEPVGNSIIIPDYQDTLQVVAVYRDFPTNCTFKNGIFLNIGDHSIDNMTRWNCFYFYKLSSPSAKEKVEKQADLALKELYKDDEEDMPEEENLVSLEPFSEFYYSELQQGYLGNIALTSLLTCIAIVIILIAVINYINFFMALVPIRIRSVNINKVFGTPTSVLRLNIISEAVGLLLLSFGLALLLMQYLSETSISDFIHNSLKLEDNLFMVSLTGILTVVTGFLVGLFPAFFITKFNPVMVMKGSFGRSKQGQRFRSILVVFQFTISIVLIIAASFVYLQNHYMLKQDYGFNRDHLLTVQAGSKIASQSQTFLSELKRNPAIEGIAYSYNYGMLGIGNMWARDYEGESIKFYCAFVAWDYPQFMGFKLKEGRFFNEEDASRIGGSYIFNETAAKKFGVKVGDFLFGHTEEGDAKIVGIVKDFNFHSLQEEIKPIALYEFGKEDWAIPSLANIRLSPGADFKQTADYVAACMKELNPEIEVDKISITTFDESIESLYSKEQNLTKIISLFSFVAIIISLMGVFGIVVFENQHRRKEIALRKVHGATAKLILGMFNRKFIIILLISFVIAAPIAYFAVVKWLSGFAYRTPLHWWVFAGGFLVVAFITLLTVTLQTFHTASENPIRAIKSD
jgi:putative ABC transport system permease protein